MVKTRALPSFAAKSRHYKTLPQHLHDRDKISATYRKASQKLPVCAEKLTEWRKL